MDVHSRRRLFLAWRDSCAPPSVPTLLAGLLIGGVLAWLVPSPYVAECVVLFPSTNTAIYRNLSVEETGPTPTVGGSLALAPPPTVYHVLEVARSVWTSHDADTAVVRKADLASRLHCTEEAAARWLGDGAPRVREVNRCTLHLSVQARQPRLALELCQDYLDYYREFAQKASLTNSRRARLALEKDLFRTQRDIQVAEQKLLGLKSTPLTRSWAADLGAPSSLLREIWKRRMLELLAEERAAVQAQGASEAEPQPVPSAVTGAFLNRLKLERIYQDHVQLFRDLLVQYKRLQILENLESPNLEVLDGPAVRPLSAAERWPYFMLGILIALWVKFFVRWRYWRQVLSAAEG